jgi:ADP-heptose:LPS heptosyltransferase
MILVLRALGVGDLATAVPALRALRAAFPDRTLTLAAPGWLAPLAALVGDIDQLVPTDGLEPIDWQFPAPYLAVNLHGRGPQSHRVLQAADPVRLGAFACGEAGHTDGPQWSGDEHEVHRWCRLLRWYGIEADPDQLNLRRPRPDRVPVGVTIVHPGTKEARKRWPPGRFAAVARELTRLGHRVVVTGSAAERELAEQVATRAGLPGTAVFAGRVDLAGLAALVAHGRLVVCADTGIAHLATAYATPSVVLFGPVSPDQWGPPPGRPWHQALWAAVPAQSPEADGAGPEGAEADGAGPEGAGAGRRGIHPALAAISVDDVLGAACEVDRAGRVRGAVTAQ